MRLESSDSVLEVRRALWSARHAIALCGYVVVRDRDVGVLQRLIDECDRQLPEPVVDGGHGDRHTDSCGCEAVSADPQPFKVAPDLMDATDFSHLGPSVVEAVSEFKDAVRRFGARAWLREGGSDA